jgi:peptidoglycan/xylan/chitin deacetylase (PgdA/CDA1 family)
MRIISPLLKHVVYPGLSRSGYLRHSADGQRPAVVTYHGVLPQGYSISDPVLDGNLVSAEAFRAQIRLLKSNYNLISPAQFLLWCENKLRLPPRSVLLTCDDGLLNVLTEMVPILREFEATCLFFVTSSSLSDQPSILWYEQLFLWMLYAGENLSIQLPWRAEAYSVRGRAEVHCLWYELITKLSAFGLDSRTQILENIRTQLGISQNWQAEYSEDQAKRRRFLMLNSAQLQELALSGMTIGAHTLSHPMLSQMPAQLALHEISQNRSDLERALSVPVWALAFPFGHKEAVSARESELARQAGYSCAFMNVETCVNHKFSFRRIHVSSGMNLAEFEAHVSGFYRSVREKYGQVFAGAGA